jgi:hypothetical protein
MVGFHEILLAGDAIQRDLDGIFFNSIASTILKWQSKVSKVKQFLYTPWRRLGGEEV